MQAAAIQSDRIQAPEHGEAFAKAHDLVSSAVSDSRLRGANVIREQTWRMGDSLERIVLEGAGVAAALAAGARGTRVPKRPGRFETAVSYGAIALMGALAGSVFFAESGPSALTTAAVTGALAALALVIFLDPHSARKPADAPEPVSPREIDDIRFLSGKGFGFVEAGLHVCDGYDEGRTVFYDAIADVREHRGGARTGPGRVGLRSYDSTGTRILKLDAVDPSTVSLLRAKTGIGPRGDDSIR